MSKDKEYEDYRIPVSEGKAVILTLDKETRAELDQLRTEHPGIMFEDLMALYGEIHKSTNKNEH